MFQRSGTFIKSYFRISRTFKSSGMKSNYLEVKIPVPWGHIAGRWWGPTNVRPILVMHGWQDNCGTFNRLLPLITENVGFLAIDLPGHGYSSHLPSGSHYDILHYVILVQFLVDYFKWPRVSLMGHSLGARSSVVYTILNPKNVDFLICLDGTKPLTEDGILNNGGERISKLLQYEELARSNKEPPAYTMEEIKRKISSALDNSIAYEHSHHLAERNTAPSKNHPGKYYFIRDPRLKVGELTNWAQNDLVTGARNVRCPIFIAKAIGAPYYEAEEYVQEFLEALKENNSNFHYHRLEGTHHLHLNNPEVLAGLLRKFLKEYHTADRSVGGLKKEMIIKSGL